VSPLELGTAFVAAGWVGAFALAAAALQSSGRLGGGGDGDKDENGGNGPA
jgi:hypothetical protein